MDVFMTFHISPFSNESPIFQAICTNTHVATEYNKSVSNL